MENIEKDIIFLIADLASYTAFTEAHGDSAAVDIIQKFINIIKSSLSSETKLKERIGDEVLIVSSSAEAIALTAVKICKLADKENNFPGMHIGIHKGMVIEKEGRYFGSTLNLTSRIADYSREGQIICSKTFMDAIVHKSEFQFNAVGLIRFKNYSIPMELFELSYQKSLTQKLFDPVCKMQVIKETAPAKLPFEDKTYYFCSFECARKFSESPATFLEIY